MKKATIIFLMILYLLPTMGVSLSAHYCGGKVTSISLKLLDIRHKCPCGKKAMKKDCCKDETKIFKLDTEQQKVQMLTCSIIKSTDLQPELTNTFTFPHHSQLYATRFDRFAHPPDDLKHPLYIRHCVFRI